MINYWWMPCVVIMYVAYGWLTKQNNTHHTAFWFWSLTLVGALPLWSMISRTSKNLLADGFIYDFFMLTVYVGTLIYLGEAEKFVLNQWVGLVLCLLGILLMKLRLGV